MTQPKTARETPERMRLRLTYEIDVAEAEGKSINWALQIEQIYQLARIADALERLAACVKLDKEQNEQV